ncbi:hypothetical protein KL930_005332 [Ogataea haglerorum]|uniref:Uncharacterized protein n=1 Tax=Ogataea haglerorum TaxID=1937702 RepID=A0AAN6D1Z1_9ASCO|nr:uncharacterized protein KL911_002349 [Ogataea haglerorum]KAG7696376.1 hypothetical protein KL915_002740 [Ogataea haglerorum]KAG7696748.1 hypothetical protein KL951_003204 [Ogataea haglerorum]KAG7706808.1 hypothetical protein KL914_002692 [Ogataea haglerorum]KAG7708885.1 hypothetical protein KL950_002405 [Ogataea haglerorum]KAG7716380.1 hypothetical protein KL913_003591 [Ogataea haglerorum]
MDHIGQSPGAGTSPRITNSQLNKPITADRHILPNRLPSTSDVPFVEPQVINSPMVASLSTNQNTISPKSTNTPSLTKLENAPHSSISSNSSSRSRRSSMGGAPLSPENLIDVMEKEQEGIVLKLMKEIQILKEENKQLKQQLAKFIPGSATGSNSSASNSSSVSRSSSQRRSTIGGSVASSKRLPSISTAALGLSSFYESQPFDQPDFRTSKTRKKGGHSPTFANYSLTSVGRRDSFTSDKVMEDLSPLCMPGATTREDNSQTDQSALTQAR